MWALTNVRQGDAAGAPTKTLLLAEGRIRAILESGAALPAQARVVDANGMLALPAFIDLYALTGAAPLTIDAQRDLPIKVAADLYIDMREANRKGIAPSARVADRLTFDSELRSKWRAKGYSHLVLAPADELLSGQSALVVLREQAARDLVVDELAFDHAGFDATGPGYPGTLMGSMAQLRQFFLDARWVSDLEQRQQQGKPGPRPPYDLDLRSVAPLLRGERRLWCEAQTASDIDRWLRLADELGFEIGIVGGRDAFERARQLAERKIPVILTLQWGEEPPDPNASKKEKDKGSEAPKESDKPKEGDKSKEGEQPKDGEATKDKDAEKPKAADRWSYSIPESVKVERRRRYDERRACARVLLDAGVVVAFGSAKDNAGETLSKARALVDAKLLSESEALAALSATPAKLLDQASRLGRLEAGLGANLALWTKNPFLEKEAKVAWCFVEGIANEFEIEDKAALGKPAEGADVNGEWELSYEQADARPATLKLEMNRDGVVKGSLRVRLPGASTDQEIEVNGKLVGRKLNLEGSFTMGAFPVQITLEGALEGEELSGSVKWKGSEREDSQKYRATKKPKHDDEHGHGHPH